MEYQTIQLTRDAGIATITLNRPEKRNAISFQLVAELLSALDDFEQSPDAKSSFSLERVRHSVPDSTSKN